ncbi:MAG: DUF4416 family protein [bacterium]|nr:DUF4416 family protein [bacterium]
MGKIKPFVEVSLFIGLLYKKDYIFESSIKKIKHLFGKIKYISDPFLFSHTKYYKNEMGDNLVKRFISIDSLWEPACIYKAKIWTNDIENQHLSKGKRLINIDPGSLSLYNIILLTTKNYSHRFPLNQGIYGEISMIYDKTDKEYKPMPWTYPDYKTTEYQSTFKKIREFYKDRVKQ